MKKQPHRLQLKKETLAPMAGGREPAVFGVVTPKDSLQDCTSPLCGPTTCPASCDCQTGGVDLEENLIRH